MKIFLLTVFFFSFALAAFGQDDPVVAEVNGKTIRKSTLFAYHQQNLSFVQSSKEVTLESSLNDLIDRIIGIENAKKDKIHEQPEVVKKMNDVVYHAFISKELTPKLQKIKVTESDIKEYYEKYPEYRTSQILFRLRTLPSDADVAVALDKANQVYKEVGVNVKKSNIEKFKVLAAKHSQSTSAVTGGDMGYQPRTRLTKQYFDAIHKQPLYYVTKPFRSQYGYHVVMVTGVKKYEEIDKKLYEKIVYDQKRDKILAEYFKEQREKAKIKINKKAMEI